MLVAVGYDSRRDMTLERLTRFLSQLLSFGSILMQALWAWIVRRDNASFLTSATLWVNLLAGALYLLAEFSGYLPPEWQKFVPVAVAILNAVLVWLKKRQPAPVPDVPTPEPSPAADLLDLIRRVVEAVIAKKIPASEAKPALLAKVSAALDEAETFDTSEGAALLKELKA